MRVRRYAQIERLEQRALFAQILVDPTFGAGDVAFAGHRMLEVLPDDKVLAAGNTHVTRFNSDGSVDATFNDASAVNDISQLFVRVERRSHHGGRPS